MRCEYDLEKPWAAPDKRKLISLPLLDTVTNKELAKLQATRRHSPIHLGRPRRVSWRATVDMPRRRRVLLVLALVILYEIIINSLKQR